MKSFGKFEKIKFLSSIFSNHRTIRLDVNYRAKKKKNSKTWRLNNMLLYNQWITEEIKVEAKKYLKTNNKENMMIHNLWDAADGVLRGSL